MENSLKMPFFKGKKEKILFSVFAVLTVSVMIVIFIFSSEKAEDSSKTSGGVIKMVLTTFYSNFEDMPKEEQINLVSGLQHFARKFAHGSIYFMLSLFCTGAVLQIQRYKTRNKIIASFLFTVFYAATDEIHQLFVPGRACRLKDVFIDSSGSFLGAVVMLGIYLFIKFLSGKKNKYLLQKS